MQYRPYRYPSDYVVAVETPFGPGHACIADVNRTGARLSGLVGLARGDKLCLDVLSLPVDAIVLWTRGDQVGISFRPAIGEDVVEVLRRGLSPEARKKGHGGAFRYPEMR